MTSTDVDAVVVGGGFAGVAAARELAGAGLSTTLLEARDRLGGRTWTTELDGTRIELGGTWIHWNQPHVWAEMTRYGLPVREDSWDFDAAVVAPGERRPAGPTFARVRELFTRYAGDARTALPHPHDPLLRAEAVAQLDRLSMQDRLDELVLEPEDEASLSGLLFEVAGSPLDEAALLPVLRWMALCGWDIDRWYETNRYRPVGGTVTLLDAMAGDHDLDIRLTWPVAAVEHDGDRVRVTSRDGEQLSARVAVLAVPVNLWPHIDIRPGLPEQHRAAARVGMGKPCQDKLFLRVRGPVGRVFGQLPAPAPMNFFWTFEELADGSQIVMAINAAPELDVADHAQVAAILRDYVPEIDEVIAVVGHRWGADEFARGGNACHRPGQVSAHLAALQEPVGRLTFATADLASGWFGYIDGAIESGIRAARHARRAARS